MFLLKLLAVPVWIALTLIQWAGIFLVGFSSVLFDILAVVLFLTAVLSRLFGLAGGGETLKMLALAFAVFVVPYIGGWVVVRVANLNVLLRHFVQE